MRHPCMNVVIQRWCRSRGFQWPARGLGRRAGHPSDLATLRNGDYRPESTSSSRAASVLDGGLLGCNADACLAVVSDHYAVDEAASLQQLMVRAEPEDRLAVRERARQLVEAVRSADNAVDSLDALLQQYSLETREGVMLM